MHHEDYNEARIKQNKAPLTFIALRAWSVHNATLEGWFQARKAFMRDTQGRSDENDELEERVAFHGTREENIEGICAHGLLRVGHPLNPSASTDPGYFGDPRCGVYTSRFVEYTLQYSNTIPAADGSSIPTPLSEEAVFSGKGSAVVYRSMLAASDIDNTSDQLAFAERHCGNGWFARSSALRDPIVGFTQRDVERGGVAFVHAGVGAGVPACFLVVSDDTTTTAASESSVRLNLIPTVALGLGGQPSCCYAVQGSGYAFAFSPATFADADKHTLAYTATLPDGAPLPSWLTFNGTTRTLAGVPPAAGPLEVRVAAADGMGATAAATMRVYFEWRPQDSTGAPSRRR
eukprot:m51a1_g7265 hypothetical protein (347) ;mRNA; f:202574-204155